MPATGSDDRPEQIKQITAAWEEWDETGDLSVIADHLAEDVVFMPDGESPIVGKETVIEWMTSGEQAADHDYQIEQVREEFHVSGDLAVDRGGAIYRDPNADGDPVVGSHKDLDVYRRDENGEWKYLIWIGNDQI